MREKYNITGMSCAACAARIEKAVSALDGVEEVSVNLLKNNMTVSYNENTLNSDAVISAVVKSGYGASAKNNKKTSKKISVKTTSDEYTNRKKYVIWSFVFAIPLFYLSMGHMMGWYLPDIFRGVENGMVFALTQLILLIPIMVINIDYYKNGFKTLFRGSPNMDSLIAIGSGAAAVYGIFALYKIAYALGHGYTAMAEHFLHDLYFEGAGTILALISLGKFFESRAKGKTTDAINKLLDLAPKTAVVLRNNTEITIPAEEVVKGDIVIVKAGESVPVDGIITEGAAALDEAAITGESIPVEKTIGDSVIGATINKSGYFKMEATNVGEETALSQIIKLVDDATSSKAPIAKLADKISGVFVPVVIAIAVVSAVVWLIVGASLEFALSIGISVLVVSCPCALGLATPTAIMVGTGRGAANGILIKSAEALETAHSVKTIVFDKTGTITEGKPEVTDIICAGGIDEAEFLKIAASLEKLSEHPLSLAIVRKAGDISYLDASGFKQIAGQGISAVIDGKTIFAGNLKMMNEFNLNTGAFKTAADKLSADGKTVLYFAKDSDIIGIIAVSDVIKPESKTALDELKRMKINIIMLTGDNKRTAEAIGRRVGADRVMAEVLPQDKEKEIRRLQEEGQCVAMVGDGINDAPALARADIGIAIGAGTDIAMDSADIVLMKSGLLEVPAAIELSRATMRNIKQNLFWAFFYNILGIPIAAGCFYSIFALKMNPMIAALAMSFSSVFVVTNALRLRFFKPRKIEKNSLSENKKIIKGENKKMTKKVTINGMMCQNCAKHITEALNAVDGIDEVSINLEEKYASVTLGADVPNEAIKAAVSDAGYEAVNIENA